MTALYFNGIVLISSVLNLGTISFNPGRRTWPYIFLPAEPMPATPTAWYHKVLKDRPGDLSPFLEEARKLCANRLCGCFDEKVQNLGETEKSRGRKKRFPALRGLSEDYLVKANLRVNLPQFMKELQRRPRPDHGGASDGAFFRFGVTTCSANNAEYDPQDTSITGPFTAAFNNYVRDELKFRTRQGLSHRLGRSRE